MPAPESTPPFRVGAQAGWNAAWLELEHQAEHWDTPDHGATGHLIAEALRAAALIGRAGGLRCEHRAAVLVGDTVLQIVQQIHGVLRLPAPAERGPARLDMDDASHCAG